MNELASNFIKNDKPSGETIKLYEQIVIRNFDILKSLLPRMNSLYQLNEQLQRSVSNIETRLIKMENDNQNIHYEMRTSHLSMDTKLNSIIADYNNIMNETNKVKKQAQHLTKEIKDAKSKRSFEKSQKEQNIETQNQKSKQNMQEKVKKLAFAIKDQVFPNFLKKETKKQPIRKSSISLENLDSPPQSTKVKFKLEGANEGVSEKGIVSIRQHIGETEAIQRKPSYKGSKSSINGSSAKIITARSQKDIRTIQSIQQSQAKSYQKFVQQIENYHFHNQKMKQNYEELMEEYCKTNQINFKQINEKINNINAKLSQIGPNGSFFHFLKASINLELEPKLDQMRRQLIDKIDRMSFDRVISDFNTRILGIHQQRKKTANREETKKALEFLQNKINGVLNDYYEAKQKSIHHVSVDKKGCFRAEDIIGQRNLNECSRQNLLQSQTNNITPRTLRNQSAHSSKRQAASLHARLPKGRMTQNRFNQGEWRSVITEKGDSLQDVPTRRKPQGKTKIALLNKKAYQILGKQKGKERPRLKKQRLIFQYD